MNKKWSYSSFGIPDSYFTRGKAPMTKEEVRGIVMGKLRLQEGHTFIDVGAGTGSVSVEAALKLTKGKVYAIEYQEEALDLLGKNIKKFQVENIKIMRGRAENELKKITSFDRIFVGGSGGALSWILDYACHHLTAQGRIVITAITIETLNEGVQGLKAKGFQEVEVISVGISKGRFTGKYTLMEAQNSVYIISASKK